MDCRLFGARPLHEPIMILFSIWTLLGNKLHWKFDSNSRLQNGGNFFRLQNVGCATPVARQ